MPDGQENEAVDLGDTRSPEKEELEGPEAEEADVLDADLDTEADEEALPGAPGSTLDREYKGEDLGEDAEKYRAELGDAEEKDQDNDADLDVDAEEEEKTSEKLEAEKASEPEPTEDQVAREACLRCHGHGRHPARAAKECPTCLGTGFKP